MAKRASTRVIRSWFGISCPMAVHTYLLFLPLAILPMLSGCVEEDGLEDLSGLAPDEVAVAAVHPASMQLPLASSLGVTFSRDLAPAGARPGTYVENPAVTLHPDVRGVWKWRSASRLEFIPDGRYEPNTTYTFIVDPRVGADAGYRFKGKRTFTFTSEPFRLVEARIFRERADDGERAYRVVGTFTFNYPVAPEAFERCFSLELKRRGSVEWELETRSDSENLSFHSAPIALEEKDAELAITVEKGLQPTRGDAALAESVVRTIKIPALERLVVERMLFETVNGRRQVRIKLSDEVDPADLEKALSVEPEPKDLVITSRKSDACLQGTWDYATYYRIRLSADLTSVHGFVLDQDFEGTISVGRLEPSVEISGHGSYLAIRGDRTIGVETVNIDEVTIELDRIYANNLVPFLHRQGLGTLNRGWWRGLKEYGTNVFRRDMEIPSRVRNEKVITPLSLADELERDGRGVFRLAVRKSDDRRVSATKAIVATDLGIVAKRYEAGVLVAVVSIRDLKPLAGVKVEVLSYNNQTIATGRTDTSGLILFENLEASSSRRKPFVIVATRGQDLGFLAFKDTRIPTGDFDVEGIDHPCRGYDAFVYSDRGIYRPGDAAHVAWIVRDAARRVPEPFPLTLLVIGPDGRRFKEARVIFDAAGMGEYTLTIPDWAQTGGYDLALKLDETTTIGAMDLRVEDFMPDRMKVSVNLLVDGEEKAIAHPGETVKATVRAMTLFGPPAAGRRAAAQVRYFHEPVRFEQWKGFTFGDVDERRPLPPFDLGEQKTDVEGVAEWTVELPELDDHHGWIRAQVGIEVTELGGGRAVGAFRSVLLSPVSCLIGLRSRRAGGSDYEEPGQPIGFEAVMVDLDGAVLPAGEVTLKVYRKRWHTVLRRDRQGRYRYVSEFDETQVEERTERLGAGKTDLEVTVSRHGSYRLVLESAALNARSCLDFYVYGWGYSPWAMSNPEKVSLKLDKDLYRPGGELTAEIEAPFEGLLLLTLEREKVFHSEWVSMESNSAVIKVRLPEDAEPNTYLVATLLRPLGSLDVHAPARAFGAAPVFMDRSAADLTVEARAPEVMRPRSRLEVDFRLPELAPGKTARVTVAAVDEGILQITDFGSPDPLEHFFRRRRLSVESFDIWSLLLPDYESVLRSSAAGGGSAEEVRRKNLNPISVKRVKPVALWSGIVDGSGQWRTVGLDVPEFNGALRIMVVAASEERFGSTERLVRVRDPIVLTPNLPRFLAPGDDILIPVQVFNGVTEQSGEEIPITVTMKLSGPVEPIMELGVERRMLIPGGEEEVVHFRARAAEAVGQAVFEFIGEGGNQQARVRTELAVRPPQPHDALATAGIIRAGEPARATLSDRWYEGTAHVTISVSPLPAVQFGAGLRYLLRYPYGCIEQTISRSFPLLYFADLARQLAPGAFGDRDADYFVNSGIDRVISMQNASGGFSYWPGSSHGRANPWVSAYATHFLVEALRKGYVVPDDALETALGNLKQIARRPARAWEDSWGARARLSTRAYAVYVLALAGEPERGAMDYMLQNALSEMTSAARTHLAGTYGLLGNPAMMEEILPARLSVESAERSYAHTWRSAARDEAIQLEVLAAADAEHPHVPVLLKRLTERARNGRWHNTQENAFAFLALGKLIAGGSFHAAPGEILLNGEKIAEFDTEGTVLKGSDWCTRQVEIRATGPGMMYYSILDEGIPRQGEGRIVNDGLTVSREYLDEHGEPVDPECIAPGKVIVCRLTLSSSKGLVENVVIADLVPAGLEIENPRLMERGGFAWIAGMEDQSGRGPSASRGRRARQPRHAERRDGSSRLRVEYLDIRDDRLLLFTFADRRERVFYYGLRAVTAGAFVLPPVKAEAMYDPDVRSIRGGGTVIVAAP